MDFTKRGIDSLKKDVMCDCARGENCFHETGCIHFGERTKCFHNYCDKFAWVLKRAREYSKVCGLEMEEILQIWENDRDYWYMNYYQECKQPSLDGKAKVHFFEDMDHFKNSTGDKGYRCPYCGGISSRLDICDSGLKVELINGKGKKEICNWSAGGLFGTLGKGVYVFLKDRAMAFQIFMPIAWEGKQ